MSFNATLLPPTVAHPTAAELYSAAGTDFDSLSTFEQWWVQWYLYFGDPIIATGLLSFTIHEVRSPPISYPPFKLTLNPPLDCLFWTFHSMDNCRRHPVLPQVEIAAE
jgi:hypothetical protein